MAGDGEGSSLSSTPLIKVSDLVARQNRYLSAFRHIPSHSSNRLEVIIPNTSSMIQRTNDSIFPDISKNTII